MGREEMMMSVCFVLDFIELSQARLIGRSLASDDSFIGDLIESDEFFADENDQSFQNFRELDIIFERVLLFIF